MRGDRGWASKRARWSAGSAAGCASFSEALAHSLNLSGILNPTQGPAPTSSLLRASTGCSAPNSGPCIPRLSGMLVRACQGQARSTWHSPWLGSPSGMGVGAVLLGTLDPDLELGSTSGLSAGWREDTSPKFQKNPLSHLCQQSSQTPGGCLKL